MAYLELVKVPTSHMDGVVASLLGSKHHRSERSRRQNVAYGATKRIVELDPTS